MIGQYIVQPLHLGLAPTRSDQIHPLGMSMAQKFSNLYFSNLTETQWRLTGRAGWAGIFMILRMLVH